MHYHRADRDEFVGYLVEKFPKCFFDDPPQRRPLKHTIIDDLEKENVLDREKLAQAIHWYQSHFSYQYALVAGNARVDLDGNKAGTVTPLEQSEALRSIAERKREMNERRAAPSVTVVNKVNGHVITKASAPPSLHPLLADMQSAIGIVNNILSDSTYKALRPALTAAALKEIIACAEKLALEINQEKCCG
jgi:hypothetical protein